MTVPPDQSVVNVIEYKVPKKRSVSSSIAIWCSSYWKHILSEFVSTSILLLMGCMSIIPIDGLPFGQPMYTPIAFGMAVLFNVQIFGHLSGAHMNPAVTLAAVIWGTTSIPTAIAYMVAQCAGAIVGYGTLAALSPVNMAEGALCVTQRHAGLNVWQAVGIEVALTTVLNFLNCAVWDPVNKHKTESVPIKFGLTIAGLSLSGGPLTGASMNPARSLGPALVTGIWKDHWVYWVGPLLGGIFPTVIYKYIWLKKDTPTTVG